MSRKATVMECGPSMAAGAVELRFRGRWLVGCGFEVGRRVRVVNPSPGVLELRVASEAEPGAEYLSALGALERVLS